MCNTVLGGSCAASSRRPSGGNRSTVGRWRLRRRPRSLPSARKRTRCRDRLPSSYARRQSPRVEIRSGSVWMAGRRARGGGSCNDFGEEHRGTNQNPGTAGGRDVATGTLCSRLHRSGPVAATLRAECRAERACTALRTRFGATRCRRAAQAPPATRAKRRSEANGGNSGRAARRRRKIVRRPALGRVDSRGGRSRELARRDQEARRKARSQAGGVRLAWSGRGRRCGGSRKAPPWLPFFPARWQDEGRVRSSGDVDGGYDASSPR